MPDEIGTETTRSDAPKTDGSPFAETAEEAVAAVVGEAEDSTNKVPEDPQGSTDARQQDAGDENEQTLQSLDDGEEQTVPPEELKVVVSIKGGRASIGVQQPSSSDPHIETFGNRDLSGLAQEVPAVVERARTKWEDNPKHPAYERHSPPSGRRPQRRQGSMQASAAGGGAAQQQPETLRLF